MDSMPVIPIPSPASVAPGDGRFRGWLRSLFTVRSFSTRLLLVITATSTLGVLGLCAVLTTLEYGKLRDRATEAASTQSKMLALNAGAALVFGDPDAAEEVLASLSAEPDAIHACIFDDRGKMFATYGGERPEAGPGPITRGYSINIHGGVLWTQEPILLDGEYLGTLAIAYSLEGMYGRLRDSAMVAVIVALGACLLSVVLAAWFRRGLSEPIAELNRVMTAVRGSRDYRLRARRIADDELGELTDGLNALLGYVEAADDALIAHTDQLEARVIERTSELETAKLAAESASRAKSRFLANMSHEIRTPMTAILGYSDMLLDQNQPADERLDCVQTVHRNGQHLMSIINDVLDISKIEAGHMTVEHIPTCLVQLVADVASLTRIRAVEKGIGYSVRFDGDVPATVYTDPTRLRQILINIVGNAIKFTETGSVNLRFELLAPDENHPGHRLAFEVRDTGIGMTEDQMSRLFQAFTQSDESVTRRFGGTGLGLAISKQLARMLGGDIEVQSQPGLGSRFLVIVGAGDMSATRMLSNVTEAEVLANAPAAQDFGLKDLARVRFEARILLVEDGEDNRRFISRFLAKMGVEVGLAENGLEGHDAALDAESDGRPYDLILMDMQMPVMDGYSATRKLRLAGYDRPIVALTAHAMADDRRKCLDAGCDDYLTKPIHHARLIDVIGQHARGRTDIEPAASDDTAQPGDAGSPPPARSLQAAAELADERGETPAPAPAAHTASSTAPPTPPPPPSTPPSRYDDGPLVSRFADDPMLGDLVEEFVDHLPARLAELEAAAAEADLQRLAVLTHQLKGSAGTHGFDPLSVAARRLETDAKESARPEDIGQSVRDLIELCRRVRGITLAPGDSGGFAAVNPEIADTPAGPEEHA